MATDRQIHQSEYFKKIGSLELIIFSVFGISLALSVTNLLPGSVIYVLLIAVVPYIWSRSLVVPAISASTATLIAYFFLMTIIYKPLSFLDPEFWRRDGNVFITLFPLLILPFFPPLKSVEKIFYTFLAWATFVNLLIFSIYLTTGNSILTFYDFREHRLYHFLFIAHNAAGGFLALITCLSLSAFLERKSVLRLCLFLLNSWTFFLTMSRGSLLALLGAIFMVIVLKNKKAPWVLAFVVLMHILLLTFSYEIWVENGSQNGGFYLEGLEFNLDISRPGTLIDRAFFLWPRAVSLFLNSPIFGGGFGSFNDIPFDIQGIPGLFALNASSNTEFNSAHAHHSFLHILAETGIIGLGLTVFWLILIYKCITNMKSQFVRQALLLAFWMNIYSSMTEHRLFTPSQMIPFFILLGFALARRKNDLTATS